MTDGPAHAGWDDIVVGAGSAGAVLANRLTARPDRRVLLLEAGADSTEPERLSTALGMPVLSGHNWEFTARISPGDRVWPYRVGKVVGGSSAVNGAIALRALPADFDRWAAGSLDEWAWPHVLPYFARLETDTDRDGPAHGDSGPLPISRPDPDRLDPLADAFRSACRDRGLPALADLNEGGRVGVGLVPSNAVRQRRVSTARAYLEPARRRPNLVLRDRCHTLRVLVEGGRAVGVEVRESGETKRWYADRITLCAGALNTPVILQRSGIGDADRLRRLGVRPVADLPGVGHNLSEHVALGIWTAPRSGAWRAGAPWHQVMARVASDGTEPDLNLFLANNVTTAGMPGLGDLLRGRTAACVSAMLMRPTSRGSVHIRDTGPDTAPEIDLSLAATGEDVTRLMHGVRLAWSLLCRPPIAPLVGRPLLWTERMIGDDTLLAGAIRRFATPMYHPTGTARMGTDSDPLAVADQRCRVRAVTGLRVADASVMPSIPSMPTNLACVMLAERIAEWMA